MDIDALEGVRGRSRFDRWLAVLAGLAALSGAFLVALESNSSRLEERAYVLAARLSVDIFGKTAGGSPRTTLGAKAQLDTAALRFESSARRLGAGSSDAAGLSQALSSADAKAARRLDRASAAVTELPGESSGVDAETREVIAAGGQELRRVVREQNRQVDLAEQHGRSESRAIFALTLVALSGVLLGVAGVMRASRAGVITLVTAGALLAMSVLVGASGVL
jgi:hypothetical protein